MIPRRALALVLCACASPLDASSPAWRRVDAPGPSPRWGQGAVYDAAGDRMLVFGGETARGETAEVWSFDLASETWTQLAVGAGPEPRVNPGVVLDAARARLIAVDGRRGATETFTDAWALDLAALTWTELAPGPPSRQRPHAATDGTRAWFEGGEAYTHVWGDLWELDLATDAWTALPTDGDGPGGRTCGAFAVAGDALVLLGGHDVIALGGAFSYDLAARRWSKLAPSGGTAAGAHWAYALDGACARLYLATGDHDDKYDTALTDVLDLAASSFSRVHVSALPPPRDHATLVVDDRRRTIVLFGGGINDGEGYFGDTWIYPLPACP
jgi:hypothetical protein